jgi:putative ABC transport system permease protein
MAGFRIPALDRKLLRDLLAMRGQAMAIALVIASGITMFVAYLSNFDSLERTRQAYYERERFADVFASATRAPNRLRDRIQAIPGVEDVETRVVADVVLDVPGLDEPASGRLISVPGSASPQLNDLFLRTGRWVSPTRPDEVIASEAFVEAHGFHPGDHVYAVINGRRRELTIVGVALSPEYVYSIRPGEIVPDPRRYGIFWMERKALASAFAMEGGFNDVSASLARGAVPDAVLADLDRLLAPYGGRGAVLRAQQFSNWTVENELQQLRSFGLFVPVIFLLVAAFVLNIALTRALTLQRPQLAALKALGYTNGELAWHYLKWALAIAAVGAVIGLGLGIWAGTAMLRLYVEYFKFPILTFTLSPFVVLGAVGVALAAAMAGAWTAVHRAVRIAPAEAMRPEAPARYRRSVLEAFGGRRRFSTTTRMIVRNLERQPIRALTTIVGIAFGAAILQVGFSLLRSMDQIMITEFSIAQRQDLTIDFTLPESAEARLAVARLPGVLKVEPSRLVPVRLRSGHRERTLALTGLPPVPDLTRPIDRQLRVVAPPAEGVILSSILARALDVHPGDTITAEVMEGARPVRDIVVAGLVDDIFGISAYMDMGALHRLMREGDTLSGASVLVDPARERELSAMLKRLPAVAGIASKRATLENFRRTMAENMGVMLTLNVGFAGIIAFGVVYNAARVSLSERSRELASLRVLGFTRTDISLILLGELAILTVAALPIGAAIGYGLTALLVGSFQSEIYRFPFVVPIPVMATAALTVVVASLLSGLVVRRRLDRLDLVGVLKLRE